MDKVKDTVVIEKLILESKNVYDARIIFVRKRRLNTNSKAKFKMKPSDTGSI